MFYQKPTGQPSDDSFFVDENNTALHSMNIPENELSLEIKVDQISSK